MKEKLKVSDFLNLKNADDDDYIETIEAFINIESHEKKSLILFQLIKVDKFVLDMYLFIILKTYFLKHCLFDPQQRHLIVHYFPFLVFLAFEVYLCL